MTSKSKEVNFDQRNNVYADYFRKLVGSMVKTFLFSTFVRGTHTVAF